MTKQELEARLATTISPILVAVAVFCLTVMAIEASPRQTFVDEIFGILGLLSLFSAALIVDSLLDEQKIKFVERLMLMSTGYFIFSFIVGAMSTSILLLYYVKNHSGTQDTWDNSFFPFILTGIFIVLKLMSHEDRHIWLIGMMFAFVWSLISVFS
jgi:hypothetical protein